MQYLKKKSVHYFGFIFVNLLAHPMYDCINEASLILDINDNNVLFITAIEINIFLGLELKLSESIAAIRMMESTDPYIVQELTNLLIEKRKK